MGKKNPNPPEVQLSSPVINFPCFSLPLTPDQILIKIDRFKKHHLEASACSEILVILLCIRYYLKKTIFFLLSHLLCHPFLYKLCDCTPPMRIKKSDLNSPIAISEK